MAVGDETLRDFPATRIRDPLLGTTVDDYVVQAIIGTGAMGIVYRGVHQVIGKAVAIKVLKPDYATDPEMVQRLIREARTVNAIRHPAIVDIFGFGTLKQSGQPYIVMDLLEGEPLDAFIKREAPVPPKVAFPILDELLGALAAAHGVGVIHRDLKPGNVFVESHPDQRSRIKVIDFGLARQANRAGGSVRPTNPGTLLGTPAFMAPEQVMGTRVTPATDLYAVGGIAYQLLTGHLPHEAPTAIEVISQKMQHDPIRPRHWNPKIEEDLDAWVMSLLRREATDRPPNVESVRVELRRAVDARTQDQPGVKRRTTSGPMKQQQKSGTTPVHKPTLQRSPVASNAGVVPKWGAEPRTMLVDGSAPLPELNPIERTTDQQLSPFAQTAKYGAPGFGAPELTPPMSPSVARTDEELRPPPELVARPEEGVGSGTLLFPAADVDAKTLVPGSMPRLITPPGGAARGAELATQPAAELNPAPITLPGDVSQELPPLRAARWPWVVLGLIAIALVVALILLWPAS